MVFCCGGGGGGSGSGKMIRLVVWFQTVVEFLVVPSGPDEEGEGKRKKKWM